MEGKSSAFSYYFLFDSPPIHCFSITLISRDILNASSIPHRLFINFFFSDFSLEILFFLYCHVTYEVCNENFNHEPEQDRLLVRRCEVARNKFGRRVKSLNVRYSYQNNKTVKTYANVAKHRNELFKQYFFIRLPRVIHQQYS